MSKKKKTQKTKKNNNKIKNLIAPILLITITFLVVSIVYLKKSFLKNQQSKTAESQSEQQVDGNLINLPVPSYSSKVSLEETLKNRLNRRNFISDPLELKEVSQLLWAAQGITTDWGNKTTESYKSEYPLRLFLISDNIKELDRGLYEYIPGEIGFIHQLKPILTGDVKQTLTKNINQTSFTDAPFVIIITANLEKISKHFPLSPEEGVYLTYIESGSVIQNLYLQVESLNLGLTENLTFDKQEIKDKLKLEESLTPIAVISIGNPSN
jgi:SagB-type dehydrogenase family enzyme